MTRTPVLNFKSDEIHNYIEHDLNLFSRIEDSFNYVYKSLQFSNHFEKLSNNTDLNQGNWLEGKNYDWLAIESEDVKLLIRKYQTHFTIFSQFSKTIDLGTTKYTKKINSAFTYYTDTDKVDADNPDFYYENPCYDLNSQLSKIISFVKNDKVHSLWNSVSFKRPDWVDIELVYSGTQIFSVDQLIFCSEELSELSLELFSETDMVKIISNLEEGVKLSANGQESNLQVKEVHIDPNNFYRTGITILNDNFNKIDFHNVYSLTRFYYEYLV